jgi:predicted  nucleic acid-binding Zn-ribbon protein
MQKDLDMLLKIQEIDYDITELEHSKSYIPEIINTLKLETEELSRQLKAAEDRVKELTLNKKNWEVEVGGWQEDLEKFKKQMLLIKTNKEYDALTAEIETRKQKIAENEDQILQAMQELEETNPKIEELKKKLQEAEKGNSKRIDELQEQIDGVDSKIKIKLDERKKVTPQLGRTALATYERIRKKCTPVVVSIRKRACGACYKSFPPQRIQEIRKGDGLLTCDNCGRILSWSPDSDN